MSFQNLLNNFQNEIDKFNRKSEWLETRYELEANDTN